MAGAVPQVLVEDLWGLDLDVATTLELGSNLALDQAQEHGAVRQPEGHPGGLGQ